VLSTETFTWAFYLEVYVHTSQFLMWSSNFLVERLNIAGHTFSQIKQGYRYNVMEISKHFFFVKTIILILIVCIVPICNCEWVCVPECRGQKRVTDPLDVGGCVENQTQVLLGEQ